ARFGDANAQLTDVAVRAGRWQAAMFPTVMIVANVATVGVLWFGGHRVENGNMEVGALTAYISYLMQIVMSVMMAMFMLMMVPRASVCADRITEVLDTESSVVVPPSDPVTALPERLSLQLDGVTFAYPGADEPVLREVTLTAEPGETVAIVGSTGAGKSTL
ncbi:ABC transporter ATP-binding protein, partial [Xanthomonas citri pv. citri]